MTTQKKTIFGLIQEENDSLFSPWVLSAYKYLESDTTQFVLVGGGPIYKEYNKQLGCKNVLFLPLSENETELKEILKRIHVFMHGSMIGETELKFIRMAQEVGVPIVSHYAQQNNGHVEVIGESGVLHGDFNSYIFEAWNLAKHDEYRAWRGEKGKQIIQAKNEVFIKTEDEWLLEWLES